MELSNWKLDTAVSADAFTSAKASGAMKIPFAPPTGRARTGLKPPAPAKPAAKIRTTTPQ
jgi:hypothetical protein